MGIFGKFSKMAYINRKKDEAKRMMRRADQDYDEARRPLVREIDLFNNNAQMVYHKKTNLLQKIGTYESSIKSYKVPCYKRPSFLTKPEYIGQPDEHLEGLKILFDNDEPLDDVEYFMRDVERYYEWIYDEIKDMQEARATLKILEQHLKEEDSLLSTIENSINNKRDMHSEEIAKRIQLLLIESICDDNGRLNSRYLDALSRFETYTHY